MEPTYEEIQKLIAAGMPMPGAPLATGEGPMRPGDAIAAPAPVEAQATPGHTTATGDTEIPQAFRDRILGEMMFDLNGLPDIPEDEKDIFARVLWKLGRRSK